MRITATLSLTFALWATALPAADPALLRLIPGDAAFVAGIHADQIRNSRFGQYLLDQLKSEQASMDKFISATGFDPRRDLSELIVSSNDVKAKGQGLVVARGRFDSARIQTFAESEGARAELYNGVKILSGGSKNNGGIAMLDNTTAVAGDAAAVRLAIDRFRSTTATGLNAKTLAQIGQLSSTYDAWMVSSSLARIADDMRNPQIEGAMNGNLFQSMDSVAGGVRFGSANVEVMAEAAMRSEKDATAMVDVIRFLAGMIQMNAKDPNAAEMASLLNKMELKATGTQFRMSLQIPEDQLEKMVKPARRGNRTVRENAPVI